MRFLTCLCVALYASLSHAFAPASTTRGIRPFLPAPSVRHTDPSTSLSSPASTSALSSASSIISAATDASSDGIMSSHLMNFFLETLISLAVPAVVGLVALTLAVRILRPADASRRRGRNGRMGTGSDDDDTSALAMLYDDLYGGQLQDGASRTRNGKPFWQQLFRQGQRSAGIDLPKNIGIPAQEYISITNVNQKLDSYRYSLTAATQTKALAASDYRNAALRKALDKSLTIGSSGAGTASTFSSLSTNQLAQLAQTEKEFLRDGRELVRELNKLQAELTQLALDDELQAMGLESAYELDPSLATTDESDSAATTNDKKSSSKLKFAGTDKKRQGALLKRIAALQMQQTKLELKFRQDLITIAGPAHAASLRAALIGSTTSSLLSALQDRPLSQVLGAATDMRDSSAIAAMNARRPNLFVTNFPGDASASQVRELREEVTAICQTAQSGDEALVVLQTGGGTVTGYGLATAQLLRLKEKGLKLTIAVEQVAASGGYMMCCVADHIVASPFAVLGSIGVISDIPNVYERLKSEGIEFQTVTAGKFKRTLTPTKKVTKEDFVKTSKDLEDVFILFRDFVAENRPQLDIENIATGETWFGTAALERKLCDEIKAVDDVILEYVQRGFEVLEVDYTPPVETVFGTLSPARAEQSSGPIGDGIRWLVKAVASEIKAELGNGVSSLSPSRGVEERFKASDDTAERTRIES